MRLSKYKIVSSIIVVLLLTGSSIGCSNEKLKRTEPGKNTVVLLTPGPGEMDVPRNPTFTWEPIPGAISYDFEITDFKPILDEAHQFNNIIYSTNTPNRVLNKGDNPLVDTFDFDISTYQGEVPLLNNSTIYLWRVRAVTDDGSAHHWSSSNFTTRTAPLPPTTINDPDFIVPDFVQP
jgi:hypothetical protein